MDQDVTTPDPENEGEGEKGFVPPKDGSWVPRDRFNEGVANALKRGRAEGELAALKESKPEPQESPKEYTRTELQQSVDAGQITQESADHILDQQGEQKLSRLVDEKVEKATDQKAKAGRVADEIKQYVDAVPDVMAEGSDARARVRGRYDDLVGRGYTQNLETQLLALELAYGPAGALQKAKPVKERETHQETGSGTGGQGEESTVRTDGVPKGMSAREKAHYQGMIDRKLYPDWKAVEEELKFSDPSLRKRMGAR